MANVLYSNNQMTQRSSELCARRKRPSGPRLHEGQWRTRRVVIPLAIAIPADGPETGAGHGGEKQPDGELVYRFARAALTHARIYHAQAPPAGTPATGPSMGGWCDPARAPQPGSRMAPGWPLVDLQWSGFGGTGTPGPRNGRPDGANLADGGMGVGFVAIIWHGIGNRDGEARMTEMIGGAITGSLRWLVPRLGLEPRTN